MKDVKMHRQGLFTNYETTGAYLQIFETVGGHIQKTQNLMGVKSS